MAVGCDSGSGGMGGQDRASRGVGSVEDGAREELRVPERGAGETSRVALQQRIHQRPQQELCRDRILIEAKSLC